MIKVIKSLMIIFSFLSCMILSTHANFIKKVTVEGNQFSTGTWHIPEARVVINEVYYDVTPGKGGDGNVSDSGEWIELYNAGDASIDLQNWTITDNTTLRVITTASRVLNPGNYALIAKDNTVWTYWAVPSGTELIELNQVIGGGLANGGDRLTLRNNIGGIVDQMNWMTDTTFFSPACTDVAEGHSLERSPAGKDTNTASDFVDRAVPTPGT